MKSRREFYEIYFTRLNKMGFDVKPSEAADIFAEIQHKKQIVAFYTRSDTLEQNPFVDVKPGIFDKLREAAKNCALQAGICTEKPYGDKAKKQEDNSYQLCEFGGVAMDCKRHPLFEYVFNVYRLAPEAPDYKGPKKLQREVFYNREDAMRNFAVRSGLVDENLLFSDLELKIIRSNLVKMSVDFDKDISADAVKAVRALVDKIEVIKPELRDKKRQFDFSKDFGQEHDAQLEIGQERGD